MNNRMESFKFCRTCDNLSNITNVDINESSEIIDSTVTETTIESKSNDSKKSKKKNLQSTRESQQFNEYYICNNCGTKEKIKDLDVIIVRNKNTTNVNIENFDISDHDRDLVINLSNSNLLPYVTKYICPNDGCNTNKGEVGEARFFRNDNSFNVIYYCTVCGQLWTI